MTPAPPGTVRVTYYGGPLDGADKTIPRPAIAGGKQIINCGLLRLSDPEYRRRQDIDHPKPVPCVIDVYVVTPGQWPTGPVTLSYAGQDIT